MPKNIIKGGIYYSPNNTTIKAIKPNIKVNTPSTISI